MEDVLKKKIITVCAAVLFLTALGLTLYPLISNYVNQKYASEIQTAYQVLIQQTDESVLQEARQRATAYNLAITPGTAMLTARKHCCPPPRITTISWTLPETGLWAMWKSPKFR